jgi:Protein of unknown function (DUF499)
MEIIEALNNGNRLARVPQNRVFSGQRPSVMPWRPATAEEGFEIVRRRLFEPLAGPDAFKQRDVTARAFADLYHAQSAEFPPECKGGDYEKRIQAAYPIHPEIFDRLYSDWSTLVKFQRTRGVLRLMAAVIHSLWEKGDRNPLILPSTVPIDDARVQSELTRYLSDNWAPIIEKDVDGSNSLPLKIDAEQPSAVAASLPCVIGARSRTDRRSTSTVCHDGAWRCDGLTGPICACSPCAWAATSLAGP